MTRTYPRLKEVFEVKQQPDPDIITQTRTYKLITPLFGGGAKTQKPDDVTTVRATEVRGHLRFWWRATRGGMFNGDLKKMKEAEELIWGAAAKNGKKGHSKVKINVKEKKSLVSDDSPFSVIERENKNDKKEKRLVAQYHEKSIAPAYVAFPLQPPQDELKHVGQKTASVKIGVEFILEISYPKELLDKANNKEINLEVEIGSALWAWETFGGIGARTRRGFGALLCDNSVKPTMQSAKVEIQNRLNDYVVDENFPKGVPHLSKKLEFRTIESQNEISAWKYLIEKMKNFRQNREPAKDKTPGRSYWPEPDSIRRILNEKKKFTFGVHNPEHKVINKFPRAKFGLPINFEFPKKSDRDPNKTILQGKPLGNNKYIDRLASPLIVRPISCSDGAIALAVKLEWKPIETDESYTPPGGLFLTGKGYGDYPVDSNIDVTDAKNIEPLKSIKGKPQPDVLQAFLDYLK